MFYLPLDMEVWRETVLEISISLGLSSPHTVVCYAVQKGASMASAIIDVRLEITNYDTEDEIKRST
jgi:hypothetical protein